MRRLKFASLFILGGLLGSPLSMVTPAAAAEGDTHILSVPPAIKQGSSMYCWAAGAASWLQATGINPSATRDSLIVKYGSYMGADGSLAESDLPKIFLDMGMSLKKGGPPSHDELQALLESKGHVIFLLGGANMGHTLVVYGVGVDASGKPNKDYFSAMDPMYGTHVNLQLSTAKVVYIGQRK
jgi:hypothetical protein